MYLDHFSLTRHPFRMAPEDDFVYMSQQHSRAFVYMDSTLWSPESFVVITGEVGAGKTTLLKKLINSLSGDVNLIHVAYTNLSGGDLFQLIAHQAGLDGDEHNKIANLLSLRRFLEARADENIPVVLAVDEAQSLSRENLEDIRMLAGLEGRNGPMMRVILLGQPELNECIHELPQLTQRVKLFFHLGGLSKSDTGEYIAHRLSVAGRQRNDLFDPSIIQEIHALSGGIPRLINKLCDALLLCAFADDRCVLDPNDLDELKHDLLPRVSEKASEARQVSAPLTSVNGNHSVLYEVSRIAGALENIDHKLDELLGGPALDAEASWTGLGNYRRPRSGG